MKKKGNKFQIIDDKVKIEILYKKEIYYAYCDLEDWNKVKNYTWTLSKDNHGHTFYVRTMIGPRGSRKQIYMHRLVMDTPRWLQVDHLDWDGRNNCKYNLKNVTAAENLLNRRDLNRLKPEEYPLGDLPPF